MKRELSDLEMERLCDIRDRIGEGDMLDFIQWVQRTAKKYGWSVEKTLTICEHMPSREEV